MRSTSHPVREPMFGTIPWPQFAESREAGEGGEGRKTTSQPSLPSRDTTRDTSVLTAYGFNPKKDMLAQLLALNREVAAKIERDEPVTAPGVPKIYADAKKLVTEDCSQPEAASGGARR